MMMTTVVEYVHTNYVDDDHQQADDEDFDDSWFNGCECIGRPCIESTCLSPELRFYTFIPTYTKLTLHHYPAADILPHLKMKR